MNPAKSSLAESRTGKSLLNIFSGMLLQTVLIGLGFFSRKIFVDTLGFTILGINGLFQNIISFISLIELGIGTAIVCNLYKPLAEKDIPLLNSLMSFYGKTYRKIALAIALICAVSLPFVHLLFKGELSIFEIRLIYILFVIETVISYLFVYKKNIIIADQKQFLINSILITSNVLSTGAQILVLYLTKSYLSFLTIRIIFRLAENLYISKTASSKYPFLNDSAPSLLPQELRHGISNNTKALIFHYFALYFVNSTDNLIVSHFLGITYVGFLVNYQMIFNAILSFISQFSKGIIAGYGNLLALESKKKAADTYYLAVFVSFWICNFASASLLNLTQPFIELWLGTNAMLPLSVLFLLTIDFFIFGMTAVGGSLRSSAGVFMQDRYYHFFAAIVNFVLSIILVQKIGLPGVIIGTIVYRILEYYLILGLVLHKCVFFESMKRYFIASFKYLLIYVCTQFVTYKACISLPENNTSLAMASILGVCLIIPNSISFVFLHKTPEFDDIKARLKVLLNKR
jgi:O-antigen/teichoic acid export membrane protein